jgi:cell division inhibitor SulA
MNKSLYLCNSGAFTSLSIYPPVDQSPVTQIKLSPKLAQLSQGELSNWLNLISPPVVNWHGQYLKHLVLKLLSIREFAGSTT